MEENPNSRVKTQYFNIFKSQYDHIFSSGGRFEVLGNHTDHNHGKCIAATCDLCITGAIGKREDKNVRFISEGFDLLKFSLKNLRHRSPSNSSIEMIKGVADYYVKHGYKIGGFNAYCVSNIFPGAGVSSSAAFLLLIAQIFNQLFNDGKISVLEMCKAGQYSENNYYEKKSGLLDEIGVAYGNLVSIDFEDIKNPRIENVEFPFKDLHFVIVNTGGSHAALNDLYSAIPNDMYNAAKKMNHNFLRECKEADIVANPQYFSEIEFSRAIHYFSENQRVDNAINAIKNMNEKDFLDQINASRKSSTLNLKNMMVEDKYNGSPLEACERAMEVMENNGACKINGGGFAGSIICLVPSNYLNKFISSMSDYYGDKNVKEVFVRPTGPCIEE